MTTSAGEPTAAIYGTAVLLLKLLREERPEGIAFARDLPKPTFRHERYDAYKAGRPPMPDELRTQWGRLDELLAATSAPVHAVAGYEADDVLATIAHLRAGEQKDTIVVSGDRDLYQVVGERTRVLFLGARGKKPEMVDEALVRARYGVAPRQMPSWAALVGEVADNLPGVPGIGAKTATKLVATYGSIARLVEAADTVTPPKIGSAIAEARETILRNEELATLRRDLPLESPLVGAVGERAFVALRALFVELEFRSLVERLEKIAAAR